MRLLHMVVLGLLIASSASATTPPPAQNEIVPFTTDGCSVFPDGDWLNCCIYHDYAHWKGGTFQEKVKADVELARCALMSGQGWFQRIIHAPIAGMLLIGGSIGGLA